MTDFFMKFQVFRRRNAEIELKIMDELTLIEITTSGNDFKPIVFRCFRRKTFD